MFNAKLKDIPPTTGDPRIVNAIIEIPKGNRNKYEVDKKTGLIKLDRYLFSSSHYPGDYGFVPQTLALDDDPLDVIVRVRQPTFSGCLIEARVIGVFEMEDKGKLDNKILAIPNEDPLFEDIQSLEDMPKPFLREVEHFFSTYKQLEGVTVKPLGWFDVDVAIKIVEQAVERFKKIQN